MICRKCGRAIDFVQVIANGYGQRKRIVAVHGKQADGLNDHVMTIGYRDKRRRELEGTCKLKPLKGHVALAGI